MAVFLGDVRLREDLAAVEVGEAGRKMLPVAEAGVFLLVDELHEHIQRRWQEPEVIDFRLRLRGWDHGPVLAIQVAVIVVVVNDALVLDDVCSFVRAAASVEKDDER